MKEIDYSKIGTIIDYVTVKLNNYMIDCPEVILDDSKIKNLLNEDGLINNLYKVELSVYYAAMLAWYCSNDRAAKGIVEYCNKYCSLLSESMLEKLKSHDIKSKINPADTTKIIMNLAISNLCTKIGNAKNMNVDTLNKSIIAELLNEKFNQKATEYNLTLISESFNKVNKVTKGDI